MADLAGTQLVSIVSSSTTDSLGTIVMPTSDTVTAATATPGLTGLMRYITITTPAMTGTGTATFMLKDAAGGTLFSQAQDESVVASYGSVVPLKSTMSLIVTASGTQAALGTCVYNIYYDK